MLNVLEGHEAREFLEISQIPRCLVRSISSFYREYELAAASVPRALVLRDDHNMPVKRPTAIKLTPTTARATEVAMEPNTTAVRQRHNLFLVCSSHVVRDTRELPFERGPVHRD